MLPTITLFYAAVTAIWLIVLSARVITYRRGNRVEIMSDQSRTLDFRIRAQGNLTEYAPLALILLALLELHGLVGWGVHILGLLFLTGRFLHGWSFSFADGHMNARVSGMFLTLTMILVSAVIALGFVIAQV